MRALVRPPTAATVLMRSTKHNSAANKADFLVRWTLSLLSIYPTKGMRANATINPKMLARYDHLFPILSLSRPKTQTWKTIVTAPENPRDSPISWGVNPLPIGSGAWAKIGYRELND